MAFESSTARRMFFGGTERFEVWPGALRGWSCDAVVVMMSPYLGECRSWAQTILGEMLVLRSEDVSWGPQEDGRCVIVLLPMSGASTRSLAYASLEGKSIAEQASWKRGGAVCCCDGRPMRPVAGLMGRERGWEIRTSS